MQPVAAIVSTDSTDLCSLNALIINLCIYLHICLLLPSSECPVPQRPPLWICPLTCPHYNSTPGRTTHAAAGRRSNSATSGMWSLGSTADGLPYCNTDRSGGCSTARGCRRHPFACAHMHVLSVLIHRSTSVGCLVCLRTDVAIRRQGLSRWSIAACRAEDCVMFLSS